MGFSFDFYTMLHRIEMRGRFDAEKSRLNSDLNAIDCDLLGVRGASLSPHQVDRAVTVAHPPVDAAELHLRSGAPNSTRQVGRVHVE